MRRNGGPEGKSSLPMPQKGADTRVLNAPRRNRTYNLVIKSHLLCQLS
jgi:hypothetical protein